MVGFPPIYIFVICFVYSFQKILIENWLLGYCVSAPNSHCVLLCDAGVETLKTTFLHSGCQFPVFTHNHRINPFSFPSVTDGWYSFLRNLDTYSWVYPKLLNSSNYNPLCSSPSPRVGGSFMHYYHCCCLSSYWPFWLPNTILHLSLY